jgi:hypothetical protein
MQGIPCFQHEAPPLQTNVLSAPPPCLLLYVAPQCMEVFQVLWRDLQRRDLLVVPKVHISPSCGHQEQRLREYVRRLQGQLAESPGELLCQLCWWGSTEARGHAATAFGNQQ